LKVQPGFGAAGTPDAHIFWLGQPWHADTLPAALLCTPGQAANKHHFGNAKLCMRGWRGMQRLATAIRLYLWWAQWPRWQEQSLGVIFHQIWRYFPSAM